MRFSQRNSTSKPRKLSRRWERRAPELHALNIVQAATFAFAPLKNMVIWS